MPIRVEVIRKWGTPRSSRRVIEDERVVRVQGGEHEVAGERGLHRVLRGLRVADLAHHDDVGVLAQHRAQGARRR